MKAIGQHLVLFLVAVMTAMTLSFISLPAHSMNDGGSDSGGINNKDTMIDGPNEPAEDNNGCVNGHVFSAKLLSGMCWDCVTPIIVGSSKFKLSMASGGWNAGIPEDAAPNKFSSSLCMCNDALGLPTLGVRTSLWEPHRLVEFQRRSGCSSVLNGIRFPFDKLNQGTDRTKWATKAMDHNATSTKKHYHYYSFPLLTMLDMWVPRNCNPGFYMDLDVMYMSEIDPTWNYDEIAFFTHPEAALIASPFGALACIPDSFMSQLGKPINSLYWCAGAWGVTFPTAGHTNYNKDMFDSTSLMTVRVLYALHRRGLEYLTMGKGAMCNGQFSPYLPKNQYRFSVFHPVAETSSNHGMGAHILTWSTGRLIPMTGEDPIYVIWRWIDCCNTSAG